MTLRPSLTSAGCRGGPGRRGDQDDFILDRLHLDNLDRLDILDDLSCKPHPPPRQRGRQRAVREELVMERAQREHRAASFMGVIAQAQNLSATMRVAELIGGKCA